MALWNRRRLPCRQEDRVSRSSDLHLDANAVEGLIGAVEHTARRLWRHVNDETPLTVPGLSSLDHVAIRRQLGVVRFEGHLKNTEPVVLEQDLVVGRGGNHRV